MNSTQQHTLTQLRALRGTPLTVLVTLLVTSQPVTQRWLCRTTGYSDKTVAQALDTLTTLGHVERTDYRHWRLASDPCALFDLAALLAGPAEIVDSTISEPTTATGTGIVPIIHETAEAEGARDSSKVGFSVLRHALAQAGIYEPMQSRLAALPHVTQRYVAAHVARAAEEGCPVALLIHRIRSADPAPPDPCPRCGRTGKHALDCPARYIAPGVEH